MNSENPENRPLNTGVTLDDLRHINLYELKDLIPKERIGDRFKLRRNLEKWRIQQGYEPFYFNVGHSSNYNQNRTPQAQNRHPVMTLAAPPPPLREQQQLLQEFFRHGATPERESMTWLKHHIKPLSEVEHHWIITQEVRAKDMKYYTNPIALFAQWPHYKQSFGSGLIDMDFKFLYPDKDNMLYDKWGNFAEKALPYFRQHIKDKRTLHILSKISDNTDPNSTHYIIVLAMHAVMKPVRTSIKVSGSKSQIFQYSIVDSQGTFIIQGDCRKEIEEKIKILRESLVMRSIPDIFPLLAVVGEDYDDLQEFFVVYDGIFYKFQTFLKALDICFKLYHVFNIPYPKQCSIVWAFIQRYFYEIQRPDDEKNPNVCNFISHIK